MTINELTEKIKGMDLTPIHVKTDKGLSYDLKFVGTLDEFIQTVKGIGSTALFFKTDSLSEDFFAQPFDEAEYEVDLITAFPMLSKYEEKIGIIGQFDLFVQLPEGILSFEIIENWWEEFVDEFYEAKENWTDKHNEELIKLQETEQRHVKKLITEFNKLIDDHKFIRLPTQKAMRAYALDKLPELEELLEDQDIKNLIQDINAKIQARGLK